MTTATSRDEQMLLVALEANPDDLLTASALADAAEERGDTSRTRVFRVIAEQKIRLIEDPRETYRQQGLVWDIAISPSLVPGAEVEKIASRHEMGSVFISGSVTLPPADRVKELKYRKQHNANVGQPFFSVRTFEEAIDLAEAFIAAVDREGF